MTSTRMDVVKYEFKFECSFNVSEMRCILSLAYIIDNIVIEIKQGNCNDRGETLLSYDTFLIFFFIFMNILSMHKRWSSLVTRTERR